MEDKNNTLLSKIAIGLSLVALIFAVIAYNRTGIDLNQVAEQETAEVTEDTRLAAARAEAAAELIAVRASVEADEAYADAANEVAEARVELAAAYANASQEAQQEWVELEEDFNNLETELRDESADALTSLDTLISDLRADIRTEDQ